MSPFAPRHLCLLLVLSTLAACSSAPPGEDPIVAPTAGDTPLARATRALESGDVPAARRALEEALAADPDDRQALYLYARALAAAEEYRAAKVQVRRALAEEPKDALALSLLAALHEQLGEHHQALLVYQRLRELVPDSLDPLRGVARCQLYTGDPQAALATLAGARERPAADPWLDWLEWQALRRLGKPQPAEGAARRFLEASAKAPELASTAAEVRRWLSEQTQTLDGRSRELMVDYVRAACRLRLPDTVGPEEALLQSVPDRLLAYDDRPVFVTLLVPGKTLRLRGRGRGGSLLAALKGAVAALQERPGYTPLAVREAAVRIDVGQRLEPITLRQGRHGLEAEPALTRGRHGLALRADGHEIYCLPGDPFVYGLPDLRAMLEHAAGEGGLAPDAWQSSSQAVFRFESECFLSPAPGAAPITLQESEPQPLPGTLPEDLRAGLEGGARWLTAQLLVEGGCVASYRAAQDQPSPNEAAAADEARVGLALVRLFARSEDPVLLAAWRHLAGRVADRLLEGGPDPRAAATLLLAMDEASGLRGSGDEVAQPRRDELAQALLRVEDPAARGAARLALLAHARTTGEARWAEAARALRLTSGDDPLQRAEEALGAVQGGDASQREALLSWASDQLRPREAPLPLPERARALRVLAGAALVARQTNDPAAADLRQAVQTGAGELLALQLAERHRALVPSPSRALGAFRQRQDDPVLTPQVSAECLLALDAALRVLEG